jgi:hypothetical protein
MPAEYIATIMDSGHIKWRPAQTFHWNPEIGPDDQRLIIRVNGSPLIPSWLTITTNGCVVDTDYLADTVGLLKWLRGMGKRQADFIDNVNSFVIDLQL